MYTNKYNSKIGELTLVSDGEYLTAVLFKDSKNYEYYVKDSLEIKLPIFEETKKWLDIYFQGDDPGFVPKYKLDHMTDFRKEVIDEMLKIPYGKVRTYGDIASSIARKRNINRMSAQAVGGAVGWNPICIIIPCHRVVGMNNNLTGYGGGINNKVKLLQHEGIDVNKYTIPK